MSKRKTKDPQVVLPKEVQRKIEKALATLRSTEKAAA